MKLVIAEKPSVEYYAAAIEYAEVRNLEKE